MRYKAHILANHHLVFFAAAVYHLDSDRNLVECSVAVVSESSNHSQIAALTYIDFVIKEVERRTNSTKIIMWGKLLQGLTTRVELQLGPSQQRPYGWYCGVTIKNAAFKQVKSG